MSSVVNVECKKEDHGLHTCGLILVLWECDLIKHILLVQFVSSSLSSSTDNYDGRLDSTILVQVLCCSSFVVSSRYSPTHVPNSYVGLPSGEASKAAHVMELWIRDLDFISWICQLSGMVSCHRLHNFG